MTTAVAASVCCCTGWPPPPPFTGTTCEDFAEFCTLYAPPTRTGHLRLEWDDGAGSWVEIFSIDWEVLRHDLGYPPDTPPYPLDPGGLWRAGTEGTLHHPSASGACFFGETVDSLMEAGYLLPGNDYFDPYISLIQLLRLECLYAPIFTGQIVLTSRMPIACAKSYYTPESGNCLEIDPEDPCIPPIFHGEDCCNKGCCPPPELDACAIVDASQAGFVQGPTYTLTEYLDGIWTLPVRTRPIVLTIGSCTRNFRVTTSIT